MLRIISKCYLLTPAYVGQQEQFLADSFIRRGTALVATVYPDPNERTRLYRTSLPPASGYALLRLSEELWSYWRSGRDYAHWNLERRLEFIEHTAMRLSSIRAFEIRSTVGSSHVRWQDVLRWWLHPATARHAPGPKQISAWHDFINTQFTYRLNWGLGSCISVAMDRIHDSELRETTLEEWPETDLPWIVLWMKELLSWGTLDPVAAFLLGRRAAYTRQSAEELAQQYYAAQQSESGDPLDAPRVRRWARTAFTAPATAHVGIERRRFPVTLLRDFPPSPRRTFRVLAVNAGRELLWIDVAGFPLAKSERPLEWTSGVAYDFTLNVDELAVTVEPYV